MAGEGQGRCEMTGLGYCLLTKDQSTPIQSIKHTFLQLTTDELMGELAHLT